MRHSVFALSAALLLGTVASVSAHELMIKPEKMKGAAGETIRVSLISSHRFVTPEEVENVEYITAGAFHGGSLTELPIKPNEEAVDIESSYTFKDSATAILTAAKEGSVYSITNKGGRSGKRAVLEAEGLKVTSATRYDKYVKTIVNAASGDQGYAAQVGQDLEILPVTNPADVKVGEYFDLKVLHRGEPVSIQVLATYDGFVKEYENTYAYATEMDSDGVAHIKITTPGLWVVRATVTESGGVAGEYDTRVIRSVLLFEVQ